MRKKARTLSLHFDEQPYVVEELKKKKKNKSLSFFKLTHCCFSLLYCLFLKPAQQQQQKHPFSSLCTKLAKTKDTEVFSMHSTYNQSKGKKTTKKQMETLSVSYSATYSHTAVKDTDKVHAKKGGRWNNSPEMPARAYLFQCCFVLYRAGNMMGRTVHTLSLIRLRMYSLFQ